MNTKITKDNFNELMLQSLKEGLSHAKGTKKNSFKEEIIKLPEAPPKYTATDIKKLRSRLNISQAVLAQILGVSKKAIESWEYNQTSPSGAVRRLLQLLENDPELFLKAI